MVLPSVPRTYHFPVNAHALAQRAAAMHAHVVHCRQLALHVGHANVVPAHVELFGLSGFGQVGLRANFRESSHGKLPGNRELVAYFGCSVCAIITWRLKFSTMLSSRRTSVGRFARVI